MWQLFQAGLVAACMQFIAVGVTTYLVFLSVRHGLIAPMSPGIGYTPESQLASILPFLAWAYLLTALGAIFTGDWIVDFTAKRIREASRSMHPTQPHRATKTLLALLGITAIGLMVLALRSPPYFFLEAGNYLGDCCLALIAWPALMSIGAAGFGANARATRKALLSR